MDSRMKHVWRAHAYHAFLAACIHRYRVLFRYAACSKKPENEEEALVEVV